MLDGNKDQNEDDYAPYIIHNEAIDFIKENKDTTFFMWYTSVIPHAELKVPEKELLQKIAEQELSALRAGYNNLKTTEITDFATEKISGRYFGCRTDNVEMSIVFFRPAGTSDLCSYSYSRMLPRRNSSSWEVLRQKTESGAAKIKFHTLANSVFSSR
jgi:hypothetical protein